MRAGPREKEALPDESLVFFYRCEPEQEWRVCEYRSVVPESLRFAELLEALHADAAPLSELQHIRYKLLEDAWRRFSVFGVLVVPKSVKLYVSLHRASERVPEVEQFLLQKAAAKRILLPDVDGVVSLEQLQKLYQDISSSHGVTIAGKVLFHFACLATPKWREQHPTGILFFGPPGTGKNMICDKILLHLAEDRSILFDGVAAQLNEKYVGETERRMRSMMEQASRQPHHLFFVFMDEIHGLAKKQSRSANSAGSTSEHKTDALLSLLELMAKQPFRNIMFLFATNYKSMLDVAFTRSKRVDVEFLVPPLSAKERIVNLFEFLGEEPRLCLNIQCRLPNSDKVKVVVCIGCHSKMETKFCTSCGGSEIIEQFYCTGCASVMDEAFQERQKTFGVRSKAFALKNALLPLLTINFVGAQVASLKSQTQRNFPVVDTKRFDPGFIDSVSGTVNLWEAILEVAKRNDLTKPISKLFASTLKYSHIAIDEELFAWLKSFNGLERTGHMTIDLPSKLFVMEGPARDAEPELFLLNGGSADHAAQAVRTLLWMTKPDLAIWIDARFRRDNPENLEEALEEVLEMCRNSSNAVIVVEMDELIGFVPHNVSLQHGTSNSEQIGKSGTEGGSATLSSTWNLSRSRQKGRTLSRAIGTSNSQGVQHNISETTGKSVSHTNSKNWNDSEAENRSITTSHGGSESHRVGVSTGISGGTSGLNATTTVSSDVTTTENWNVAEARGTTATHAYGEGVATQVGENEAIQRGIGVTNQTGESDVETKALNEVDGKTATEGGSTALAATWSTQLSSTSSTGTSSNRGLTWQVEYPKVLHAVSGFLDEIDRSKRADDPLVLVIWRRFNPVQMQGFDEAKSVPTLVVRNIEGKIVYAAPIRGETTIGSIKEVIDCGAGGRLLLGEEELGNDQLLLSSVLPRLHNCGFVLTFEQQQMK